MRWAALDRWRAAARIRAAENARRRAISAYLRAGDLRPIFRPLVPNLFAPMPSGSHRGGSGDAIHGAAPNNSPVISSGVATLPDEAEAEAGKAPARLGGSTLSTGTSSPSVEADAGERPSRVALPGESPTRMVETETGWVRATRLSDGGWYLSMRGHPHTVCTLLSAEQVNALFHGRPGDDA